MSRIPTTQQYPRIADELLDESALNPHVRKLTEEEFQQIIGDAIVYANKKSSREILNITDDLPENKIQELYKISGKSLFEYFLKYCGDPASTAYQCYNKHYSDVAKEQFRNRTLQKERMNAGWRYQAIAKEVAILSKRFITVSDIGTQEADFNATIRY